MSDHELERDAKRAFRIVMREMNSSVRFDTPEEVEVLRRNFEVARQRSLAGLVGGGTTCGLAWRYVKGKRFSGIVAAWGAVAGMTFGMFSIRQTMFLDLLAIPEERSPFACQARKILERELPSTLLQEEIVRRRRELYPLDDDRYEDATTWNKPFTPDE